MKTAIVILLTVPAFVLLAGCATGVAMTDEEAALCKAQGCTAWTDAELRQLIQQAAMQGYQQGLQQGRKGGGI